MNDILNRMKRGPQENAIPQDDYAFPQYARVGEAEQAAGGLTARDYFAAFAMQGFIVRIGVKLATDETEKLAADAYGVADAMIRERGMPKFPESDAAYRSRLLNVAERMNDLDRYAVLTAIGIGLDEIGLHVGISRR